MSKLYKIENARKGDPDYCFYCPGCEISHGIWVRPNLKTEGSSWNFNGDVDSPTVEPSINLHWIDIHGEHICHLFMHDGVLKFLGDCTHKLAGQSMMMEEQQ